MTLTEYNNSAGDYIKKGQYKRALKILNEALLKYSDDSTLLYNRGRILKEQGDFKGAIKDLRKASEKAPGYSQNYALWGLTLYENNQHIKAEEVYLSGFKEAGPSFELSTNYGVLLFVTERYKEAKDFFAQALQFKPNNKDAQINYNDTLEMLGESQH